MKEAPCPKLFDPDNPGKQFLVLATFTYSSGISCRVAMQHLAILSCNYNLC